jgi:acetoin utilization protein AcuC
VNCIVDPRTLLSFDFGEYHPFKTYRLGLAYNLIAAYGLIDRDGVTICQPRKATEQEALTFHNAGYLEALRLADSGLWVPNQFSHGLGTTDNPVFPGVYDWGMLVAGASIDGAKHVLSGDASIAFNMSGGLHHAMPARASGFCHINDVVLAINALLEAGKRVVYVDVDAHHGDGVQYAFYKTNRVLTISSHQDGHTIFPGTGFTDEIGQEEGRGYSINIPLPPGSRDDIYQLVFDRVIFPAIDAFSPDVIVTQLGADALLNDRVASLGMSLRMFESYVKKVRKLNKPWLALGGGGYAIENVVRAWTLAWAQMNDTDLPDEIPSLWQTEASVYGVYVSSLRGDEPDEQSTNRAFEAANRTIEALTKNVIPLIA